MKLIASLIVHDERGRYLDLVIPHLLEFCDEIRVVDDASTDGSEEWLARYAPYVKVLRNPEREFFVHEGRARQRLLEWTMEGNPTHVLAIDADEFVGDGKVLREIVGGQLDVPVWSFWLDEVWRAEEECLCIRIDGAWKPRLVPILYSVVDPRKRWTIKDVALACGREPLEARQMASQGRGGFIPTEILHWGWANPYEREERFQRYVTHDGGRFHAGAHLQSIMWPERQIGLGGRDWPTGIEPLKQELLARCSRQT